MKIALFGNGKTGAKVLEAVGAANVVGPFTRSRPAALAELEQADVAVLFVPGDAIPGLLPLLLEARIPVVSGATGRALTPEETRAIEQRGVPWIQAANFSLGMNLALELARRLAAFRPAKEMGRLAITEVHHVKKLDSPSGTALALQRAVAPLSAPIESVREGDVFGIHELELHLPGELLSLAHQASDRRVFAEGALLAAKLVRGLSPGVHRFDEIVRNYCFERTPV